MPETSPSIRPEGRYDVRHGAAGYAPIVGAFGALAVPAIILLFTVSPKPTAHQTAFIALAAGLLIVAMIGSLMGSIGLAGIGAEQDPTANLIPATMFLSIPVVVSIVAVLGAFEVLASIYLPESKTLFALITGFGGLASVFFVSFVIGDSWHLGPTDESVKAEWLKTQWIQTRAQAYKRAEVVAGLSAVPALVGIIARIAGLDIPLTMMRADWLVGVAFGFAMVGTFWGVFRTEHHIDGIQRGLRPYEAYSSTLAMSFYILFVMIFLP